jgi:hypothetical protein
MTSLQFTKNIKKCIWIKVCSDLLWIIGRAQGSGTPIISCSQFFPLQVKNLVPFLHQAPPHALQLSEIPTREYSLSIDKLISHQVQKELPNSLQKLKRYTVLTNLDMWSDHCTGHWGN